MGEYQACMVEYQACMYESGMSHADRIALPRSAPGKHGHAGAHAGRTCRGRGTKRAHPEDQKVTMNRSARGKHGRALRSTRAPCRVLFIDRMGCILAGSAAGIPHACLVLPHTCLVLPHGLYYSIGTDAVPTEDTKKAHAWYSPRVRCGAGWGGNSVINRHNQAQVAKLRIPRRGGTAGRRGGARPPRRTQTRSR